MQAIIRLGNGKYYCTPVFGEYITKDRTANYDSFVVCFDEKKEKLVKVSLLDPQRKPYLIPLVLTTDNSTDGWSTDASGYCGVSFLPFAEVLQYLNGAVLPTEILQKCAALDLHEDFTGFVSLKKQSDCDKLMYLTGAFHDAKIEKYEQRPDGSLYVLFHGVWGCTVELLFAGEVSYCADGRDLEKYDPYWLDSSLVYRDGFFYLYDDMNACIEDLDDSFYWFKSKSLQYRIIPD